MNEHAAAVRPTTSQASTPAPVTPPYLVAAAVLWACVLAVAGGLLTGLALCSKFGMVGAVVLWATGALGGFVSRKLTKGPNIVAACCLVVACVVAFALAEASWYRWTYTIPDPVTGEQRDPTWVEAFTRVPNFMWQRGPISLAVGALCAFLGAQSAYWQAGKRYRMVMIAEE